MDKIKMTNWLFARFARTGSGRRADTLLREHPWTPKEIFDEVQSTTTVVLPLLDSNAAYSCKMLFGSDSWSQWLTAEGRVAGMCLAFLVRTGAIELVPHMTRSGKWSGKYCLPGSPLLKKPKQTQVKRVIFTCKNLPGM
jgi:hypothetical protein